MNKRGKFIVIEGIDGSGKGTQTNLLVHKLREKGYRVEKADFPQYEKWSAVFVEKYLNGDFGGITEVSAKQASLFYALDRYAAAFKIKRWLNQGIVVISNRYVSASKGHQLGKVFDEQEMRNFLDWINELEYGILGIPTPDLTLFLHMKPEIGQRLVDLKGDRAYVGGTKRDIHEEDINHLRNAERAFLFCLNHDSVENWHRIVCYENDQPKSIEEIHEELYVTVLNIIND